MSNRLYVHVLLGVPAAVQTEVRDYLDDDTKRGDAIRSVLDSLDPTRICTVTIAGTSYGVFLVTVDDDTDAGNIRRILDRWPTVRVVQAWRQETGLPLGQSYDADGNVIGTPRFTLTAAQYTALKAAWPAEFINADGKLVPPSRMQGQTDWQY